MPEYRQDLYFLGAFYATAPRQLSVAVLRGQVALRCVLHRGGASLMDRAVGHRTLQRAN